MVMRTTELQICLKR